MVETPAVLLLHHAAGAASDWSEIRERLGNRFRVLAPDLPEHGENRERRLHTVEAMAAYISGIVGRYDLRSVVAVGHSMGGAVALQYALDRPERVAGLVLASTSARLRVSQALLQLVREHFSDFPQQLVASGFSPSADPALASRWLSGSWSVTPEAALADFVACDGFDVRARLAEVQVPVTVLVGEDDVMTPVKWAKGLAEGIAGARLRVLPATGHLLLWERPRELVEEIVALVESAGSGSRP